MCHSYQIRDIGSILKLTNCKLTKLIIKTNTNNITIMYDSYLSRNKARKIL